MMMSNDDVTLWCHKMMSHGDVTRWCHKMMSHDDVTWWCHMMMSHDAEHTLCIHTDPVDLDPVTPPVARQFQNFPVYTRWQLGFLGIQRHIVLCVWFTVDQIVYQLFMFLCCLYLASHFTEMNRSPVRVSAWLKLLLVTKSANNVTMLNQSLYQRPKHFYDVACKKVSLGYTSN